MYYTKASDLMKVFIAKRRDFRHHQAREQVEEILQREKEYC
jgi:hypothetical protein